VPNRPVPNPLKASQFMDAPPRPDRLPQTGFGPGRLQAVGRAAGSRRAAGWLAGQGRGGQP
jgi:hypothetical protein